MRDFEKQAKDLLNRFLDRGYPNLVLKSSYQYALTRNRSSLLETGRRTAMGTSRNELRIVGQFDNNALEVRQIIEK